MPSAATHVLHVGGGVVTPEQIMRERAATDEQLVGNLAPKHPPIGHTLAGTVLSQSVELAYPHGRENEQEPLGATVDHECVSEGGSRLSDERHGIV